jgi:hypothetical protein
VERDITRDILTKLEQVDVRARDTLLEFTALVCP